MKQKLKLLAPIIVLTFLLTIPLATFAQIDVPRKTVAITYPLGTPVDVFFRGTTRFPRLKGTARVERKNRTGTKVTISLENLPRPYELGAAYTTYVIWAITPEGQVDRLGELKYRSGTILQDPKGEYTTPLQTFALIVTAEPHYLVKQPSQAVILENVQPAGAVSNFVNVQYFGNSSDYFRDPRAPEIADTDYVRTPVTLLGARQAVNMAKYAGAERDASSEFEYAQKSLEQAETAWKEGKEDGEVDILARQAIAAGVRAEEVAGTRKIAREARNEKSRNDAEIRRAEDRAAAAERERDEMKTALDREIKNREFAERDTSNTSKQVSELRQENQRLRDEINRLRGEAEDAKVKLARSEGEKQVIEQQRVAEQRVARLRAAAPALMQTLKQFGAVRETERGITVSLPESLWKTSREANLAATADPKLQRLAQVLANSPDYKILVESHTDDGGQADVLTSLTNDRARLLGEKLTEYGVPTERIEAKGLGGTFPVAPNTTNANRGKNRRVDVTLIIADAPAQS